MANNKNIALGLILGSGVMLDEAAVSDVKILLEDNSGVHHKKVYTCTIAGKQVLVFQGRKHFYEGSKVEEITANINIAVSLGVENLLITNAAGGLNENYSEGDLMLIRSHINFIDKLILHPVMNNYNVSLSEKFREVCRLMKVNLHEGTYGCYPGPTYETKSEIRLQKKIGLDAAGMSTVPEVNDAAYKGLKVIAVSVITNLLKENSTAVTSHDDVLLTAKTASISLNKVLPVFISELN